MARVGGIAPLRRGISAHDRSDRRDRVRFLPDSSTAPRLRPPERPRESSPAPPRFAVVRTTICREQSAMDRPPRSVISGRDCVPVCVGAGGRWSGRWSGCGAGRNPPAARGSLCPARGLGPGRIRVNPGNSRWHRLCIVPAGRREPPTNRYRLRPRWTSKGERSCASSSPRPRQSWSASGWPPSSSHRHPLRPARSQGKAKGKDEAKKKGGREPGGELRKAYDLLRRLRADEAPRAAPRSGSATGPIARPGSTATG